MNLYFSGMIGSGKTTLGVPLAEQLGLEFRDLDREMDRFLGYSFHRLVEEKGWLAFRELEYAICKSFARLENALICLGGGTMRYEWNRDILRGTGRIVHLDASVAELTRRVRKADRPRVNPGTNLEQDLTLIWEGSRHKYLEGVDLVFDTEGKSVERSISELKEMIRTDTRLTGFASRLKE